MTATHPSFRRVLRECERWGVVVLEVKPRTVTHLAADYYLAPQHDACIDKVDGTIVWADVDRGRRGAAGLLHEMAHVIAWRECGEAPPAAVEFQYMLAIEAEANRRCRADWKGWMEDYGLQNLASEWSEVSTMTRAAAISWSRAQAARRRLMLDGRPTYKHSFEIADGVRRRRPSARRPHGQGQARR